eukprot:scaffold4.g4592.t1
MALFVRSCAALRPARVLPSLAALAHGGGVRGYAVSVELPDEVLAAAGAAAGDAGAAGATAAAADLGGVLGSTIGAVDALHAATGLPWWATISAVGIVVRTGLLPVALRGMAASGALLPLLREARRQAAADAVAAAAPSPVTAAAGQREQGQEKEAQQRQEQQRREQEAPAPSTHAVLARFHQLRVAQGAPHPCWVLASPLLQLPVFITAMASIRTMSLTNWPGFATGGVAWFPDLTLPAMDLAALSAPLGTAGCLLPIGIALSMFANIQSGFAAPAPPPGTPPPPPSAVLWAMDKIKLLLEWMLVPLFGVALQLPQGALVYWGTSSAYALNQLLRRPAVRAALGLPAGRQRPLPPPVDLDAAQGAEVLPAGGGGAGGSASATAEGRKPIDRRQLKAEADALPAFLATTTDINALFVRAAELRSEGRVRAAVAVLQRLLELHPRQPRAIFALGQLHAALREWPASEQMYLAAAKRETDAHQRARAWFGAGVALHQQGELETAADAFAKAAALAQARGGGRGAGSGAAGGGRAEEALRVRCWVAQATAHRKLGQADRAAELLRRAAAVEPKVEELYLKPLLAGEAAAGEARQEQAPPPAKGGRQ